MGACIASQEANEPGIEMKNIPLTDKQKNLIEQIKRLGKYPRKEVVKYCDDCITEDRLRLVKINPVYSNN